MKDDGIENAESKTMIDMNKLKNKSAQYTNINCININACFCLYLILYFNIKIFLKKAWVEGHCFTLKRIENSIFVF